MVLWNFQDPLCCEVVTDFLEDTLELVVIVGYWYLSCLLPLRRCPVELTCVWAVVSVISACEVLVEHLTILCVGGEEEISDLGCGLSYF